MNERIRELARQAEFSEKDLHVQGDNFQMFAELIVRECAGVAGCNGHVSGFSLGDLIKEHFGVES